MRQVVIAMWQNGDDLQSPMLNHLREMRLFPHIVTCRAWIQQYTQVGHVDPKKTTGNHRASREICGQNLVQLAIYHATNPKATTDEIHAHLFNLQNPEHQLPPFSPSQVLRAEILLGLTRKVGSTTCHRAHLPINLAKWEMYFDMAEPFGIANTPISDMIDIDEAGIKLEHNNRKHGKTPTILRVNDYGVYNREEKSNLLLAICGDDQYNQTWHEIWEGEGTTFAIFYRFIEQIIGQLNEDYPGRSFCFTMDNLNVHHNPEILELISEAGHRYIFWAPYWSCDGAIEYVFNTIHSYLLFFYPKLQDMNDLEAALENIIENYLGLFSEYFRHVGLMINFILARQHLLPINQTLSKWEDCRSVHWSSLLSSLSSLISDRFAPKRDLCRW